MNTAEKVTNGTHPRRNRTLKSFEAGIAEGRIGGSSGGLDHRWWLCAANFLARPSNQGQIA